MGDSVEEWKVLIWKLKEIKIFKTFKDFVAYNVQKDLLKNPQ